MARENRAENRAKAKEEKEREDSNSLEELSAAFEDTPLEEEDDEQPLKGVKDKEEEEGKNSSKKDDDPDVSGETTVFDDQKKADEEAKTEEAVKEPEKKEETPSEKEGEKKPEAKEPEKAEPGKTAEPAAKEEKETKEEKKEQPEQRQLTDEEASRLFVDWRRETETALAEHHYKLSENDVAEFNENPASFIPKYASRVYLDCIQGAFQQFITYMPRMVDQVLDARKQRSDKENAFYAKWPKLVPHKDTVYRLATAYRKANPSASLEEFINEVGAQAHVALRITPDGIAQAAPVEEKKPFTPAAPSPASPPPPKQQVTNAFDRLAAEFSMEDLPGDDDS